MIVPTSESSSYLFLCADEKLGGAIRVSDYTDAARRGELGPPVCACNELHPKNGGGTMHLWIWIMCVVLVLSVFWAVSRTSTESLPLSGPGLHLRPSARVRLPPPPAAQGQSAITLIDYQADCFFWLGFCAAACQNHQPSGDQLGSGSHFQLHGNPERIMRLDQPCTLTCTLSWCGLCVLVCLLKELLMFWWIVIKTVTEECPTRFCWSRTCSKSQKTLVGIRASEKPFLQVQTMLLFPDLKQTRK